QADPLLGVGERDHVADVEPDADRRAADLLDDPPGLQRAHEELVQVFHGCKSDEEGRLAGPGSRAGAWPRPLSMRRFVVEGRQAGEEGAGEAPSEVRRPATLSVPARAPGGGVDPSAWGSGSYRGRGSDRL